MTYSVSHPKLALVPSGQADCADRGAGRRRAIARPPGPASPPLSPPGGYGVAPGLTAAVAAPISRFRVDQRIRIQAGGQIIVDYVDWIEYGPHNRHPIVITRRSGAYDAVTGGPCGWRLILEEEPS